MKIIRYFFLEVADFLYFCGKDSVANDYRFLAEGGMSHHSSDFLYSSFISSPSFSHTSVILCPSLRRCIITRFM